MLGTCVSALSARITYLARRPMRDSGEAAILRQAVASCGTRGMPALVSPGAKHEVQTPCGREAAFETLLMAEVCTNARVKVFVSCGKERAKLCR